MSQPPHSRLENSQANRAGMGQRSGSRARSLESDESQRFAVQRLLASGGLGNVFVAEDRQLQRQVALKEIREECATDSTRRERFVREAKISGQLEHPGLVPVYGMGTQADGRDFYAMRLVRGETLEAAIRRLHGRGEPDYLGLEFRQLIGRFIQVCNTMAYVHGQAVVHRDLKPSNIMLGDFGETLVVDWGVAKKTGRPAGLDSEDTDDDTKPCPPPDAVRELSRSDRSLTLDGWVVGTPAYMSPEQAEGRAGEVGPSSDLYSLGATLYAILTGRAPIDGVWVDVQPRILRGGFDPPEKLRPGVPAPLAAICARAMALDPRSRYETALELAEELERWLADRPVRACPERFSDRVRRGLRRHQVLASGAAAALVIGFLALGLALPLISFAWRSEANARRREQVQRDLAQASAERAGDERDRAEAVLRFLVDAFRKPDPAQDGRSVKVVELLDRATRELNARFLDAPLTAADLLEALGETYLGLGLPRESLTALTRAVDLRNTELGAIDAATLRAMNWRAAALQDSGQIDQAIAVYESVLDGRKKTLGAEHADTVETTNDLAMACWEAGDVARAIPLYEQALERVRARLGPDHIDTLTVMDNLAVAYAVSGEAKRAIALHELALGGLRKTLGNEHPTTLVTMNNLARALALDHQYERAIETYETALVSTRPKLGVEHPHTLTFMHGLADAMLAAGRRDRAIALYEEVLDGRRRALGQSHPDALTTAARLVKARLLEGDLERAGATADALLNCLTAGSSHQPAPALEEMIEAIGSLAENLDKAGRHGLAENYLKRLNRLKEHGQSAGEGEASATP